VKETPPDHYSYTFYADPANAQSFDEKRFSGGIGEIVASGQAEALLTFVGDPAGRRVLDVGTGTGRAALLLAERGAIVTGVDASEQMLNVARRRVAELGLRVTLLAGDAGRLEFRDRAFDIAVSLRVVMHTPNWRLALEELCRVADRLVVLDYPSARSLALVQSVGRRFLHTLGVSNEPYRVFTDGQIAAVLDRHGFRVRSTYRQFVLPIALHRAIGSRGFTLGSESLLKRAGLLRVFGSPVTLVAERCASS
jgi:ubiquinone/menaquinone biosynthesis C-methylase UbiE